MADRLHIMQTRACPSCGSLPGQPCVGSRGKARTSLHRERYGRETRAPVALQLNHGEVAAIIAALDNQQPVPTSLRHRLTIFNRGAA